MKVYGWSGNKVPTIFILLYSRLQNPEVPSPRKHAHGLRMQAIRGELMEEWTFYFICSKETHNWSNISQS